jgi:hypothetical protein
LSLKLVDWQLIEAPGLLNFEATGVKQDKLTHSLLERWFPRNAVKKIGCDGVSNRVADDNELGKAPARVRVSFSRVTSGSNKNVGADLVVFRVQHRRS